MNINNFDYQPTPHVSSKKFAVHALSDVGMDKYFDRGSYPYRYLKCFSPQRINEMFENNSKDLYSSYNENNQNKKNDCEKMEKISADNTKNIQENLSTVVDESPCSNNKKTSSILIHDSSNRGNILTKSNQAKNNPKLTNKRKKCLTLQSCSIGKNNPLYSPKFGNKYDENYEATYHNLNKALSGFKNNFNTIDYKAISNGFKSSSVPRVDNILKKTPICNKQSSKVTSQTFKLMNDKLNKVVEVGNIDNENERLKKYLHTIQHQDLHQHRLPNISKIAMQDKIKNVLIPVRNNKIMGEKYNPNNFHLDVLKSTTKRNVYGALHQH
jgi:hypothetical protein